MGRKWVALHAACLAALTGMLLAPPAQADPISGVHATSGSNWNSSNEWTCAPLYPDNGGTATFGSLTTNTGSCVVNANVNVSLSALVFDTPTQVQINNAGGVLNFVGPSLIDLRQAAPESPGYTAKVHDIPASISAVGGLVVQGSGVLSLSGS
jgi:hypothetical protein